MALGLLRPRLELTRTSRISSSTAWWISELSPNFSPWAGGGWERGRFVAVRSCRAASPGGDAEAKTAPGKVTRGVRTGRGAAAGAKASTACRNLLLAARNLPQNSRFLSPAGRPRPPRAPVQDENHEICRSLRELRPAHREVSSVFHQLSGAIRKAETHFANAAMEISATEAELARATA
jgi:hypothetical protein